MTQQTEWRIPMTAVEQQMGRLMRAPDHPGGDGTATPPAPPAAGDPPAGDAPPAADAFDAAFTEHAAPEPDPNKKPDDQTQTPPPPPPAPAGDPPAKDGEQPPAKEGEQPPAKEGEQPPAKEEPKPGASADDILASLKELVADKKPAEAPAKDGEQPPAKDQPKPIYTEEEQAFLADYEKDWGDVSKGEALKRKAEYRDIMTYMFDQVRQFMAPIIETTEALAQGTFVRDLGEKVPDYSDTLREEVIEWTKTQPAYLQAAYNQVIEGGTVDEVKDLVDRYRAATGKQPTAQPSPTPTPTPPPTKTGNELSGTAKQAAESLAPVKTQRSGVQQPGDPSSFDDAWGQFAKDV